MHLKKYFALRLLLMISVVLAVSCRGKGAVQVSEFSDPSRALPASITIVNWNAQKGEHSQFASNLKLLLEREKPDIVFLQEARTDFIKPQQMGGDLAESCSYPWPGSHCVGVLTLSRMLLYNTSDHRPILVQLELRLPESSEEQMVTQAKQDLSRRLSVDTGQIKLLEVKKITWPDSSLGCPQPGMFYSQTSQEGWLIHLAAVGQIYFYHSGETRVPFLCKQTSRIIPRPIGPDEFVPPPGSEID